MKQINAKEKVYIENGRKSFSNTPGSYGQEGYSIY